MPVEDPFKGVVRGDAVGQTEKLLEPGPAATRKRDDLLPVVGPGDHRTDGADDDIHQAVAFEVLAAWVAESPEIAREGQC